MKRDTIIAACVQFCPTFGETDDNIAKICNFVRETDADLIVFPELATSGYQFKDRNEALELGIDAVNGSEFPSFTETAVEANTIIVFGFPERVDEKVFNSSAMIEPSRRITIYRKIHLFDAEKERFDRSDMTLSVVETKIGRIGMMICFDWIFPETARLLALGSAQIVVHPSNLVLQFCQKAMFARSVENGVFTMTCNRIGTESRGGKTLTFTGASQILSNRGETLAQAGTDNKEVITAVFNPSDADDKMITENNHLLNDRQTEFYTGLM